MSIGSLTEQMEQHPETGHHPKHSWRGQRETRSWYVEGEYRTWNSKLFIVHSIISATQRNNARTNLEENGITFLNEHFWKIHSWGVWRECSDLAGWWGPRQAKSPSKPSLQPLGPLTTPITLLLSKHLVLLLLCCFVFYFIIFLPFLSLSLFYYFVNSLSWRQSWFSVFFNNITEAIVTPNKFTSTTKFCCIFIVITFLSSL